MHLAFRRGGRKEIEKVMRNQPAVFLKLLVLLVPREMKLEHSGGIKAMTDEQIERSIEFTLKLSKGASYLENELAYGGRRTTYQRIRNEIQALETKANTRRFKKLLSSQLFAYHVG